MHQKVDVLIFYIYVLKRAILGLFFMFDLLPFFISSFLVTMETFDKKERKRNIIFLSWSPNICNKRTSFASPIVEPVGP
jgi:hypothetical protein